MIAKIGQVMFGMVAGLALALLLVVCLSRAALAIMRYMQRVWENAQPHDVQAFDGEMIDSSANG